MRYFGAIQRSPEECLEALVQDEVENRLHRAEITRAQAPVETSDALLPENLTSIVWTAIVTADCRASLRPGLIELEPRL